MFDHSYYTLLASLPALGRFDQLERLPINRQRLMARLTMLDPQDSQTLTRVFNHIAWQRQPLEQSDEAVLKRYQSLLQDCSHPRVRELLEFRLTLRTIMAGLRLRHRGLTPPNQPWGLNPWTDRMKSHWTTPDYQLGCLFPWVTTVAQLLESGQSLALERYLLGLVWDFLEGLKETGDFSFGAVVVYVFQWEICERWLSYQVEPAAQKFEQLLAEVTHGQSL